MDLAACPEHGKFLIRVRLSTQEDGTIRVSRLTYEATSGGGGGLCPPGGEAEPEEARPRRRRRRRAASRQE